MEANNQGQDSYDREDMPPGGLSDLEYEALKKQLKENEKNKQRAFAEKALNSDGFA